MKRAFIYLIKLYQRHISPLLSDRCRFYPTCSQYAIHALEIHGFFIGSWLAIKRICRCNPLFKGGFDYVPERKSKKSKP